MNKTITKICIVAFPWQSYAPYKFLSDLLNILEPISKKIVLIGGNTDRIYMASDKVEVKDIGINIQYLKDIKPALYSATLWVTKCILVQIKTSLELIKIRKNIDIVIFYTAYPYYLLPLITSKVLGIKAIEIVTRSKPNSKITKLISLQDPILFRLLDGISPESEGLISELDLYSYREKLLPEGARFIELSHYSIKKKLSERKNLIGFIGRIKQEKGIMEFIGAIPLVVNEIDNVEFLIGGSGDLLEWINVECNKIRKDKGIEITITGWIGQNLPDYLNELKLIVLPTYSDAFPTIILEAMACGTPVLTTHVGAITDIIRKDGETGFIMENNSPECISKNIVRSLEYPELDIVVKNARKVIEQKYSYEAAVERYRKIFFECK